jgi:hypothetical protein
VAQKARTPHATAWIRRGFRVVEALEEAEEQRRNRARSADPNEVAQAALEEDRPSGAAMLPASGDLWGIPTLSFVLPEELRDRGGPLPQPRGKKS